MKNLYRACIVVWSAAALACGEGQGARETQATEQAVIENAPAETGITGVYVGSIDGCCKVAETVFFNDSRGQLTGVYFMHVGDEIQQGAFANTAFDATTGTFSGEWADQYGTGSISFVFTPDRTAFTGVYDGVNPWNGARKK